MKIRMWLLILLGVALIGAWLGAMMTLDPGYVLFAWRQTTIEMSLWTWVIICLLSFCGMYWLVRLVNTIGYPWHWVSRWSQSGQTQQEHKQIRLGLCAFHNGDYQRACNKLSPLSETTTQPWVVIPPLAQAESYLGMHEQGIARLRSLLIAYPNTHGLAHLTMAKIHQYNGHHESAIQALRKIIITHKSNRPANEMLLTLLQASKQWLDVIDLLRAMGAANKEDTAKQTSDENHAYQQAFRQLAATQASVDTIMPLWRKSPAHIQSSSACQIAMAQALQTIEAPLAERTADFIEGLLKQQWNDSLVLVYSELPFTDLQKVLTKAETWQTTADHSASLHLCLGRLCRRLQFWGKAADYLKQSIRLQPSKAAHAEMGLLLQQQGNAQGAIEHLRLASV